MSAESKAAEKKSCSIRELAAYVGLSTCTVSKVLNRREGKRIPEATRQRVLAAAEKLNYVPNVNAQRLFRHRSNVIGLLVPTPPDMYGNVFADAHFVDILRGMEPLLDADGLHLMLLFRNEERRPDESYQRLFRAGTIDGLLIWGAAPDCTFHVELEENHLPYLFVTSRPAASAPETVNWIASDYRSTAREVTGALVKAGCRKLLYLAGPEKGSVAAEMRTGVDEALKGSEITLTPRFSPYTPESAHDAALEAMRHEPFDGILNGSRDMTPGILAAATELGIAGNSLRLATIDCAASRPQQPEELAAGLADDLAIGRTAVESLLDLIEHRVERVQKRIPGSTRFRADRH